MSLEAKIEEAERIIEELQRIAREPLPDDPFDAAAQKWEGLSDIALQAVMAVYDEAAQSRDSQRIISFQAAFQILSEAETEMAEEIVNDPAQLAVRKFAGIAVAVESLITNWKKILDAAKQAWETDSLLAFLLSYGLQVIALSALQKMMKSAFKVSEKFEGKMRKRAFPQSTGKRFWRKRVARQ